MKKLSPDETKAFESAVAAARTPAEIQCTRATLSKLLTNLGRSELHISFQPKDVTRVCQLVSDVADSKLPLNSEERFYAECVAERQSPDTVATQGVHGLDNILNTVDRLEGCATQATQKTLAEKLLPGSTLQTLSGHEIRSLQNPEVQTVASNCVAKTFTMLAPRPDEVAKSYREKVQFVCDFIQEVATTPSPAEGSYQKRLAQCVLGGSFISWDKKTLENIMSGDRTPTAFYASNMSAGIKKIEACRRDLKGP